MSDDSATKPGVATVTPFPSWRVPLEFAGHAVLGTSIFAIIAVPAVLLDLAVTHLELYQISIVIIAALKIAEYALLATDLWLFGVFLQRTAVRAMQRL